MDESDQALYPPQRRVQRGFVQILDDDIVLPPREVLPVISEREKRIRVPRANPVHVNTVEHGLSRRILPAAAEEIDFVTPHCESAEYLMKVQLRSAGLRIFAVEPVQDEDAH